MLCKKAQSLDIQIAQMGAQSSTLTEQAMELDFEGLEEVQIKEKELDLPPGKRTWDMEMMVNIGEIPKERNCQKENRGNYCNNKVNCVHCSARSSMAVLKTCIKPEEAMNILHGLQEAANVANTKKEPLSVATWLADALADKPTQRKSLSWLGAVRIQKDHALRSILGWESMNNFCIYIVKTPAGLAYIFYKDVGNFLMASWLDTLNTEKANWLNQENKGDCVESMLALGWVYSNIKPELRQEHQILREVCLVAENGLVEHLNGTWKPVKKEEALKTLEAKQGTMEEKLDQIMADQKKILECIREVDSKQTVLAQGGQYLERTFQNVMELKQEVKSLATVTGKMEDPLDHSTMEETDLYGIDSAFKETNLDSEEDSTSEEEVRKIIQEIKGQELEQRLKEPQNVIYKYCKEYKFQGGWVGQNYVYGHLTDPKVYGQMSRKDFWTIVLGTYNKTYKEKSSYVITIRKGVCLMKVRPFHMDQDQKKRGGSWGSSSSWDSTGSKHWKKTY